MDKLIHAQTIIFESGLVQLKEKTGEEQTQNAIRTAIEYYMENK